MSTKELECEPRFTRINLDPLESDSPHLGPIARRTIQAAVIVGEFTALFCSTGAALVKSPMNSNHLAPQKTVSPELKDPIGFANQAAVGPDGLYYRAVSVGAQVADCSRFNELAKLCPGQNPFTEGQAYVDGNGTLWQIENTEALELGFGPTDSLIKTPFFTKITISPLHPNVDYFLGEPKLTAPDYKPTILANGVVVTDLTQLYDQTQKKDGPVIGGTINGFQLPSPSLAIQAEVDDLHIQIDFGFISKQPGEVTVYITLYSYGPEGKFTLSGVSNEGSHIVDKFTSLGIGAMLRAAENGSSPINHLSDLDVIATAEGYSSFELQRHRKEFDPTS